MDFGTIEEAFSGLTLQETQRTVEIVASDMPERKEGNGGERGDEWDGDTGKKELEKGEEGIESEIEKTENEERVESSDNHSEKIKIEDIREEIDGDNDNVDTEKREEMVDGDSDNIKIKSDSNSAKKKSEEKEQRRSTDSEEKVGDKEQTIDSVSEHEETAEKKVVGDSGSEGKEIGEKEGETGDRSEDKGEEKEGKKGGGETLKDRVKIRIQYPQRPFTPDCPAYLKTGYCCYGLACCFNHPLRKSRTVSPNGECKERERDGGQEKKEFVGGGKMPYAQPYPQREGKDDCLFYLNTGRCSNGANCSFNHLPRTVDQVTKDIKDKNVPDNKNGPRDAERNWAAGPSLPHTRRRPDCVCYVKEGRCNNGAECEFFHHRSSRPYEFNLNPSCWQEKLELETNFLGLPLRPGRDDCPEYIDHGACELLTACQYNHPDPDPVIAGQDTVKTFNIYDSLPSLEEHAAHIPSPTCGLPNNIRPMFMPTPRPSLAQIKQILLPPERLGIDDGYKDLQTQRSYSSSLEGSRDTRGVAVTRLNGSGSGCELEHPVRPGEPLCPAYMKSGDCKLKSECCYDHPRDQHPKDPAKPSVQSNGYNREPSRKVTAKEMGHGPMMPQGGSMYPERPGEPECAYYMRHGDCKFKSTCRFHHPRHLSNKASRATSGNGYEEMEYPERPGEPECAYYMRHGNCKFGWNCRFHHPKGRDEKKSSQWGYRKLGPTRNFQNAPGY